MKETIVGVVALAVAALLFVLSCRSFREKGFLLNNAYLYASKEEREAMDKKPHYRQSAVTFLLLGIVFLLNGLAALLNSSLLTGLSGVFAAAALVYAVASEAAMGRKGRL